jgi:hypothetical protein
VQPALPKAVYLGSTRVSAALTNATVLEFIASVLSLIPRAWQYTVLGVLTRGLIENAIAQARRFAVLQLTETKA